MIDESEELAEGGCPPTALVLRTKVPDGTCVRSVVGMTSTTPWGPRLVRSLGEITPEPIEAGDMGCISRDVFGAAEEDEHTAWEREVLDKFEVIDTSTTTASNTTRSVLLTCSCSFCVGIYSLLACFGPGPEPTIPY